MSFRVGSILVVTLIVMGCAASHGTPDEGSRDASALDVARVDSSSRDTSPRVDAGPSDTGLPCEGRPPVCSPSCDGADGLIPPLCERGAWVCPPDTIDHRTCCVGDPRPGCTCEAGEWTCATCPAGIGVEIDGTPCHGNVVCSEASECGGGTICECRRDVWSCVFAEPLPSCFCDAEPVLGGPCADDGTVCGECCPGPGEWSAMQCGDDGRWEPTVCPDVECPVFVERDCPVDTAAVLGGLCPLEGQSCGNACCSSAIVCEDARWRAGPAAACACNPGSACGGGGCPAWQGCRVSCGPDDGPAYSCFHLPEGCRDCSCVPVAPGQRCDMVDGAPSLTDTALCG